MWLTNRNDGVIMKEMSKNKERSRIFVENVMREKQGVDTGYGIIESGQHCR
jgi:hypothetical protein